MSEPLREVPGDVHGVAAPFSADEAAPAGLDADQAALSQLGKAVQIRGKVPGLRQQQLEHIRCVSRGPGNALCGDKKLHPPAPVRCSTREYPDRERTT